MSVLTHDSVVPDDILPVGYSRAARRVYIADEAGEAVPPGVAGEIVVENPFANVCTGTQAAGVQNRRSRTYGSRRPPVSSGPPRFPGQIRGFRVEIEGVEATLVRAPGVTQSAVVVRKNSQGEPMLVAYAAGDRHLIDVERLRAFAVEPPFGGQRAEPLRPS